MRIFRKAELIISCIVFVISMMIPGFDAIIFFMGAKDVVGEGKLLLVTAGAFLIAVIVVSIIMLGQNISMSVRKESIGLTRRIVLGVLIFILIISNLLFSTFEIGWTMTEIPGWREGSMLAFFVLGAIFVVTSVFAQLEEKPVNKNEKKGSK